LFFFQFQEGVDEWRWCGGCAVDFLTCVKPFAVTASGPVLRTFTGCARAVKGLRGLRRTPARSNRVFIACRLSARCLLQQIATVKKRGPLLCRTS
jgi:hypothetical protein